LIHFYKRVHGSLTYSPKLQISLTWAAMINN